MFRYRYDTETGLYYLQSRYYNPEWGRFINADGIIGQTGELLGHNLFVYCKNNPINMSDESGFRPIYTIGEETDEMVSASLAVMANSGRSSTSNTNIIKKAFNSYVEYSKEMHKNMIRVVVLSSVIIGKKALDSYIDSSISKLSNKIANYSPKYVPRGESGIPSKLPRTQGGELINGTSHIPSCGFPHTQIGWQKGRNGDYIQTLEWDYNGVPIKRVDWTDHGRPDNHTNTHTHNAIFKNGSWSFD